MPKTFTGWLKHLFWQGQELAPAQIEAQKRLMQELDSAPWHRRLLVTHRRALGFMIPALFFHIFWWSAMIKNNAWNLFVDNYFMTLAMIGGSIMAGMTSVGGGAVAFPVMTIAFSITPTVARDFAALIQSCGMSAASFTIFFMRVVCDWPVLIISSVGGLFGLIIGLEFLDGVISETNKKLGFVSIWFAFASVLLFLLIFSRGVTKLTVENWKVWKIIVFLVTGFAGGIFTALTGNGIDICTYSIMTLVFKVNEKVATPTSVILMAVNSIFCVIWRGVIVREISIEAYRFLAVCVPVVVLGAPVGSILGSHFHRSVISALVIILDTVALISAFIIIPVSTTLGLVMGAIMVGFIGFFALLAYLGNRMHPSTPAGVKGDQDRAGGEIDDVEIERESESKRRFLSNESSEEGQRFVDDSLVVCPHKSNV